MPLPPQAPPQTHLAPQTPIVSPATNITLNSPEIYSAEALQALVSMGFPEAECKAALTASMGNPDLAYEFLLTGIPPGRIPQNIPIPSQPSQNSQSGIELLRQHPQFNMLKQLIQQNPASLSQVLDLIGQQNPSLLAAIHENNEAFISMMNEPIEEIAPSTSQNNFSNNSPQPLPSDPTQTLQMLASLEPSQRAQFANMLGLSPEQMEGFVNMISSIPQSELNSMLGDRQIDPPGVIRLTEEEMASVNRLVALGFSQQQAAQAYLACDKNEALAANLLLEGGWGADDDNSFGGVDNDDDMYN